MEESDIDPQVDDTAERSDPRVLDTAETDEHRPITYDIAVASRDFDVFGLVRRLQQDDILVPDFQRGYVWNRRQADRFIESLLLGLPVPGIFLALLPGQSEHLVLDGQQRLRTLQYFYDGVIDEREFKLRYVERQFEGLTFKSLDDDQRRKLDNTPISATIVRQHEPQGHDAIFLIFERINSGGTSLAPQEIRTALFSGKFESLIRQLNDNEAWRAIFGVPSKRMKDQELILRFFALLFDLHGYSRPMKSYLNDFMRANRNLERVGKDELERSFADSIKLIYGAIGRGAFRPQANINAAVFDSVMVGTALRLRRGPLEDAEHFAAAYFQLLSDDEYRWRTGRATADTESVRSRVHKATQAFEPVQ
jgi:uncharacterized protein with ParB-like and HNH nuclease domain